MKSTFKVALLQMDLVLGNPEANRQKALQMTKDLLKSEEQLDVLLLPELWDTAYDLPRLQEIADKDGETAKAFLSERAKELQSYVVGGSIAELNGENIYNSTFVFNRQGEQISSYQKAHLFKLMNEHVYMQAGDQKGLFQLDGQTVGTVICYDIRFPEWLRAHALEGAKAMFICAEWPHPRLAHWRNLLITRAIENQMYVIACNRVGTDEKSRFCGHSMVIDPWGEVIAEAEEEETILTATIDLDLVKKVRSKIPVFSDRRPNIYRIT
ncbi:carbon-nitrogen family hydrolase [Brevibacillus daliensis]|uniref:carbon-nitrogen family hydrolase n=1 Tax=Brevibacillus daliensis TaxID=2892995 RepID=UPI001E40594C|nr:carbon-nitrogen family hydrolase [Brevibacillus daliensis]